MSDMNRNTTITSWTFAAVGSFATFCFMEHYGFFDATNSGVPFLILVGTLLPNVSVGIAARYATQRFVAVAVCVASVSFALLGNGLYYLYFAVLQDDFAWLLLIIVPVLELFIALGLLGIAIWTRERSGRCEHPGLTNGLSQ